jgi:hypothetical protein
LEDEDGPEEGSDAATDQAEEDDGRDEGSPGPGPGEEAVDEEGDDEEGQEPLREVGPPVSRRETRIRNLNRRLQDQTRRNEDLERRLMQLETNRQQPPQRQEMSPEEEQARLNVMTPEERMSYQLDKGMRQINSMTRDAQIASANQADRAHFMNLTATDRLARRFAPQVEQLFNTLAQQGRMTGREIILDYLIGQAARQAAGSSRVRQQRNQAKTNINRQRVNSGAGRSDVSSERRRGGQTLEQRLEGKLI